MVDNRSSGVLTALANQCQEDSERWFGDANLDLGHHVLAMCGEAGEVANLVKKAMRGSLDPNSASFRHDLSMEVTDVFIYILNIAAILRIDLESAYYVKRNVNEQRFGKPTGADQSTGS